MAGEGDLPPPLILLSHGTGGAARQLTWLAETLAALAASPRADPRVRAGLLLNPGIGAAVDANSLVAIDRPVVVRWTDADDVAAPDGNGERYATLIRGAEGGSAGRRAGHYVFDGDQPDPEGVRETVARQAVAFFGAHLRS